VDEREDGLSAIAAPVWGAARELVGIVALQGPSSRFDDAARARALPLLLERTAIVSRAMGA
jgi:DNA-binding IclR family transcriptional regulator